MKINKKILSGSLAMCILASSSLTIASSNFSVQENSESKSVVKDFQNTHYKNLTDKQKVEFNEISKHLNLSAIEQEELLREKYENDTAIAPRGVKTSIIKKAAKLLAAKVGSATIAEVTDFLFGWQNDLQTGMEVFLINHGWNKTVAHWTAKSIMFVLF